MAISALPTPPSRANSPMDFATKADALLGALPTFVTETNALVADVNLSQSQTTAKAAEGAASATAAASSASAAASSATAAASSASSALNAPGTSATSTSSVTVGTSSKTFTIQTGKAFSVGQFVVAVQTSAPTTNWMVGQISAHNSTTGSLTINATAYAGSGTIADWTISLCAMPWAYAVDQTDIGTAPNQIPLNQYLGGMAYQDKASVSIEGGVVTAQLRRRAPVTKTASFTVADTEHWLICNGTASITVTLPDVALNAGREIMLKTIAAFTVISNASNVVPLAGGAAGTSILAATAGKYATLVSDGSNWIIMQGN